MTVSKFNPNEWLEAEQVGEEQDLNLSGEVTTDLDFIVALIEDQQKDLTAEYDDWLKIGFALAEELKEEGRSYFHRISKFYPRYQPKECDKQYDNCLNSKKSGITIGTFFHLAKQAGIINRPKTTKEISKNSLLPSIPDDVFTSLPAFLQSVIKCAETNQQKDVFLIGAIVTLSAALPNVFAYYGGNKVYPNLYFFLAGAASEGKGRLNHCKQLVLPIHQKRKEENKILKDEYDHAMACFNSRKKGDTEQTKPDRPRLKMLFIPANTSSSGFHQLIDDNDGEGLIFETEGDTLGNTFDTDYGNYSDSFRKGFHHETISYYRKTNEELVEISSPKISAVLSGTPSQIKKLIPDAENGLFSRFIFYILKTNGEWKDVFNNECENLNEHFYNLGEEFFEFYTMLKTGSEVKFELTQDQRNQFNAKFSKNNRVFSMLQGPDFLAVIRRLGLITFRLAMIMSLLRMVKSKQLSSKVLCDERDFQNAIAISDVLLIHATHIYASFPKRPEVIKPLNVREKFYLDLPESFNRQEYLEVAKKLGINVKTSENYINQFLKDNLLHRYKHNTYSKGSLGS